MQLSLKYRPSNFSQVIGQVPSVRILINSILMNRVPKAFLVSGLHGSGKTTLARLYAAALNCENFNGDICGVCSSCIDTQNNSHQSVIEIDAASNNGVDDVRELEKILHQKVLHQYRVVILDESHMMSRSAQAALLKALEESPANIVFFLVTTDPEKLEDTVRSRCLSLPLRPLHPRDVAGNIHYILKEEGVAYEDSFVDTLSLYGGGSLRDVQQLLEQMVISAGNEPLRSELLEESLGIVSTERYKDLATVLITKDIKYSLSEINRWYKEGVDLELMFFEGIPNLLRDFTVFLTNSISDEVFLYSGLSVEGLQRNLNLTIGDIRMIDREWELVYLMMKDGTHTKVLFEMFITKVCN